MEDPLIDDGIYLLLINLYNLLEKMEDDANNTIKKKNYNKNDYSLGIVSLKITSFDIVGNKDTF